MKTKRSMLFCLVCVLLSLPMFAQQRPQQLTVQFADRFIENEVWSLDGVDSIRFDERRLCLLTSYEGFDRPIPVYKTYRDGAVYLFGEGSRTLVKPNEYRDVDFTLESSRYCFQRSMESEHFVIFWEKGLQLVNGSVSLGGHSIHIKTALNRAETIWKKYVEELGFLQPGSSLTDRFKICMFVVNQESWRADGSGQDGTVSYYSGSTLKTRSQKVGLFHCNPWAFQAEGGHTMAHEVGHVFQYLVSADLGGTHGWQWGFGSNGSGGNCWWECCAQWQAFQVYPASLFTNYRYSEYVDNVYRGFLHESPRYANYFIQYYWCQLHGADFIGRLWRESNYPEDPVETYQRMNSQSQDDFNRMIFDFACHAVTWDIDGLRDRGKNYQDAFSTTLNWVEGTDDSYIVAPECAPQNYGFNIIRLKGLQGGTTVKVHFKGRAGAAGYRNVNTSKAGWRYGLVAQTTGGERIYGEMQGDAEGTAELLLPDDVAKAWLVVTGAPTEHWRHAWDDDESNDEQWPYEVSFENCGAQGTNRTYGDYPEDYVRRDTTVVIDATLAYSGSNYSSVRVQYDLDAVSRALGVSTKQMQAVKCSASSHGVKGTIDFVGVSATGAKTYGTTTSTSSSTCYGHWFTTSGQVVGYTSSAAIFAEMYPEKYGCYVGQYPGHLSAGQTYTIRQAFVYTHTDGRQYQATMVVRLKVV